MSEVRELIDMELDAVSGGGLFDVSNLSGNIVVQPQIATQVGVAVGGFSVFGNGGSANLTQLLAQANVSSIG
ncbi:MULTISPECIES: hypothetical protein [unclassified Bradyrhizobium]|uniref:hypothetical protein n=1 Tax=unclassified Bradyrhizobium TaxID=2631580 RepID=UPI0020B1CF73|nr:MULTISPECIES: hypothetical protein [unclassified Bradyrhizobium]MCP3398812.1 hypothetical protein [Bradyrhizobium sp. CCGB20]MCP3407392.1 hypothetical protein [Bradyrhizobium sp. CCGB01]